MLDRMEADGMVRREPDPGDRRSLRVVLQPRVRDVLDAFAAVSEEMGEVFYRGLSDEEIHAFQATLERIYANLLAEG